MANDVSFQRSDYQTHRPRWAMVSTLCAGEAEVKAAGEKYLPNPVIAGTTGEGAAESKQVYERYKERALYVNAVGRTRTSLVGAVFNKAPTLTVPQNLAYMADDCDGAGVSIYQQSQAAMSEVLATGRAGLLVDYPQTGGTASVADMRSGLIRANIVRYNADQIINWQMSRVGGKQVLSRVILCETADDVDGFEAKSAEQHRELALVDGAYVVTLWRKNEKGEWVQHGEPMLPTTSTGASWTVIPFTFIGATNNDANIDAAPLYDLACVNRKHYQLGADWYNALYYSGQPQPVVAGLTEEWRAWLEKSGIVLGSRSPFLLPAGGTFAYATVPADTAIQKELVALQDQMVALGARLVQPGEASKTATQAQGEQEVAHSIVSLAAENVSSAYTAALLFAQQFMGGAGECAYELKGDIASMPWDATLIAALVSAWQSGTVPKADVQRFMQRIGLIDPEKTLEEIAEETAGEGMNLGG